MDLPSSMVIHDRLGRQGQVWWSLLPKKGTWKQKETHLWCEIQNCFSGPFNEFRGGETDNRIRRNQTSLTKSLLLHLFTESMRPSPFTLWLHHRRHDTAAPRQIKWHCVTLHSWDGNTSGEYLTEWLIGWQSSPSCPMGVHIRRLRIHKLTAQHSPPPHWESFSQAYTHTHTHTQTQCILIDRCTLMMYADQTLISFVDMHSFLANTEILM